MSELTDLNVDSGIGAERNGRGRRDRVGPRPRGSGNHHRFAPDAAGAGAIVLLEKAASERKDHTGVVSLTVIEKLKT